MSNYQTHDEFYQLYFKFTGHHRPDFPKNQRSVAQDLSMMFGQQKTQQSAGAMVVATSTGIYIYDDKSPHACLASSSFRAEKNSGFYEITSLSHLGVAFPYLALLKENNQENWLQHVKEIHTHLTHLKAINREGWLTQLSQPAWQQKEQAIEDMLQYAILQSLSYAESIMKDPEQFSMQHVIDHYLSGTTAYPVGYDTIMIGTFSVVALHSAYQLYKTLSQPKIDWSQAKVLLHNQAGRNYSAGLTASCNWLHPTVQAIAGTSLPEERILIVPYASLPESIGNENISDEDFDLLSNEIWGALFAAPEAARTAFDHVDDIVIPPRSPIPGDYDFTQADDIQSFIKRLKFSTSHPKEMLSNTVGFWLAGEASAKSWDLSKMALPGLTHGLPSGIHNYGQLLP